MSILGVSKLWGWACVAWCSLLALEHQRKLSFVINTIVAYIAKHWLATFANWRYILVAGSYVIEDTDRVEGSRDGHCWICPCIICLMIVIGFRIVDNSVYCSWGCKLFFSAHIFALLLFTPIVKISVQLSKACCKQIYAQHRDYNVITGLQICISKHLISAHNWIWIITK